MSVIPLLLAKRGAQRVVTLLLPFVLATICGAADIPAKRVIQSSKEHVEQALHELQGSSGGKLPTLYGFVEPGTPSLERYQRGYYQYEILVTPIGPAETSVQISAKITAWYEDNKTAQSNYQLLTSNGRLESDFLDRLESTLTADNAAKEPAGAQDPVKASSGIPVDNTGEAATESLPDAPSVTRANKEAQTQTTGSAQAQGTSKTDQAVEQKIRRLTREAKALEDIRSNQTKPDDLAIVKASNTPVLSRPVKGAQTILIAEADDELQVLDMNAEWVHVHLLGPSRGWVRRSQLDVSEVSPQRETSSKTEASNSQPFHKTREVTGQFPGNWRALQGKQVQIIWVEPGNDSAHVSEIAGMNYLQSLLRQQYRELSKKTDQVAGVVVVLDSAEGGMVATTISSLQRWGAGSLSDRAFMKECWFDPLDVFHGSTVASK